MVEQMLAEFQAQRPNKAVYVKGIKLTPQFSGHDSIWSRWVEEGKLQSWQVCWAVREGKYNEWLGVRLDTGRGKAKFLALNTGLGMAALKEYADKYREFLVARKKANMAKHEAKPRQLDDYGICPRCGGLPVAEINRDTGHTEIGCKCGYRIAW